MPPVTYLHRLFCTVYVFVFVVKLSFDRRQVFFNATWAYIKAEPIYMHRAVSVKIFLQVHFIGKLNYTAVLSFFIPKLNSIQTLV